MKRVKLNLPLTLGEWAPRPFSQVQEYQAFIFQYDWEADTDRQLLSIPPDWAPIAFGKRFDPATGMQGIYIKLPDSQYCEAGRLLGGRRNSQIKIYTMPTTVDPVCLPLDW